MKYLLWGGAILGAYFLFFKKKATAAEIVAEAVWQYSYHVLAGLRDHKGPVLTVANWSGEWPGLVGLLNLNGCLTKMGVEYSSIWSLDFTDEFFLVGIRQWLEKGKISHDTGHVRDLDVMRLPEPETKLGFALAQQMKRSSGPRSFNLVRDSISVGSVTAFIAAAPQPRPWALLVARSFGRPRRRQERSASAGRAAPPTGARQRER